jgi:hypothetical protein
MVRRFGRGAVPADCQENAGSQPSGGASATPQLQKPAAALAATPPAAGLQSGASSTSKKRTPGRRGQSAKMSVRVDSAGGTRVETELPRAGAGDGQPPEACKPAAQSATPPGQLEHCDMSLLRRRKHGTSSVCLALRQGTAGARRGAEHEGGAHRPHGSSPRAAPPAPETSEVRCLFCQESRGHRMLARQGTSSRGVRRSSVKALRPGALAESSSGERFQLSACPVAAPDPCPPAATCPVRS